jgi:hypothetical protein
MGEAFPFTGVFYQTVYWLTKAADGPCACARRIRRTRAELARQLIIITVSVKNHYPLPAVSDDASPDGGLRRSWR